MIRRPIILFVATQFLWLGGPAVAMAGPRAYPVETDCVADTLGLDPTIWTTSRSTFLGRAVGQSFLAVDTIITRISVWRPPNVIDAWGTRLFVTTVDTTRIPPRPVTREILQNGPTVFIRDSDPPGQFIPMDFVIEPPLVLPRPGIYALFLQREGCDIGESTVTASMNDPYPHGIYWLTGRALSTCALRSVTSGEDYTDLIFEIEFCKAEVTPVRGRTWGELKLRYR